MPFSSDPCNIRRWLGGSLKGPSSPLVRPFGWRNDLVYSWAGGVYWIFGQFWTLYGSFGGQEGSRWLHGTLEIQNAWFSARFVEYGSSSDRFSWILWLLEKLPRLPDMVFTVFSARVLANSHFQGFRSEPKRCATESYADSWWYHLGKCIRWPFHAHSRFPFFSYFWR